MHQKFLLQPSGGAANGPAAKTKEAANVPCAAHSGISLQKNISIEQKLSLDLRFVLRRFPFGSLLLSYHRKFLRSNIHFFDSTFLEPFSTVVMCYLDAFGNVASDFVRPARERRSLGVNTTAAEVRVHRGQVYALPWARHGRKLEKAVGVGSRVDEATLLGRVLIRNKTNHVVKSGSANLSSTNKVSPVDKFVPFGYLCLCNEKLAKYLRLCVVCHDFNNVIAALKVSWTIRYAIFASSSV